MIPSGHYTKIHKAKSRKPLWEAHFALPPVYVAECGYPIDEPAITHNDSKVTCKNCLRVMGARVKESND